MNKYTNDLKILLKNAEIEALNLNDNYIETYHIILAILNNKNNYQALLKNLIDINQIKEALKKNKFNNNKLLFSEELKNIIENSIVISKENNNDKLDSKTLLLQIFGTNNKCTQILKELNINIKHIYSKLIKSTDNNKNLNILKIGNNLNDTVTEDNIIYNREKEINKIIEILARKNKNNPLLIGEPGTGKTALIEYLAYKINKKEVPAFLKNKNIISISMAELVSGTKYRGEFEEKLIKIINEIEDNDNIILFIDEIHTIINAGGAEGAIDAANIMKPALARGKIKCIGATTIEEYKKSIEKDKALERRFQKILLKEPNEQETINILKKIKPQYETYHNVIINDNIINKIVKLSNKYILNKYQPDKSIDILDQICTKAKILNNKENNNKLKKYKNEQQKAIQNKNFKELIKLKQKEKNNNQKQYKITINLNILKKVLEEITNTNIIELDNINKERIRINKTLQKLMPKENNQNIQTFIKKIINKTDNNTFICKTKKIYPIIENYCKINNTKLIKLTPNEYNNDYSIYKITGNNHSEKSIFDNIKIYPNTIIYIEDVNNINDKVMNMLLELTKSKELVTGTSKINLNLCKFIFIQEENNQYTGFLTDKLSQSQQININNKIPYKKTL